MEGAVAWGLEGGRALSWWVVTQDEGACCGSRRHRDVGEQVRRAQVGQPLIRDFSAFPVYGAWGIAVR